MTKLYAVTTEFKTSRQLAREAVTAHRQRQEQVEPMRATVVREGVNGMRCFPSHFRFWWYQDVIKPAKGTVARSLGYGKLKDQI